MIKLKGLRFYAAFEYKFNEDTVDLLQIGHLKIYKGKTGVFTVQTALNPNLASLNMLAVLMQEVLGMNRCASCTRC